MTTQEQELVAQALSDHFNTLASMASTTAQASAYLIAASDCRQMFTGGYGTKWQLDLQEKLKELGTLSNANN